jgi:NAD(P)-dependent dehydrogenase (short-subunit alcohol dehydrogenase family)/acyl carrier protein
VLAGLAPAVAAEFPSLRCVHVDVAGDDPGAVAVLGAAAALDAGGQVALRDGRWHAARLARLARGDRRSFEVRPDATYLVTGGWGGIGLAVAGWLAGRGARHLALVGRTCPAPEPEEVGRLRAAGVEVAMLEAQAGDAPALERALAEVRRTMPPLRGVVHAAGVTADAPFEELDWPRVAAVLEPKVRGAWHLHRLTAGDELDWFVACSSLVALLGSGGQAAYAMANAFLDELARWRRERGQPALSVAWGPWSETGMAVRQGWLERFARLGVRGLPTRDALDALGELLADAPPHVAVADVDWARYVEATASDVPHALLADLATAAGATPAWRRAELERMAVQAPDEARSAVLDELLDRVAVALGLEPGARDELRPTFSSTRLNQLGLDSLMAVRLRGRLLAELGADVPPQTLIGGGTVADVAELVVEQLALGQIVAADDEPVAEDTELVTL